MKRQKLLLLSCMVLVFAGCSLHGDSLRCRRHKSDRDVYGWRNDDCDDDDDDDDDCPEYYPALYPGDPFAGRRMKPGKHRRHRHAGHHSTACGYPAWGAADGCCADPCGGNPCVTPGPWMPDYGCCAPAEYAPFEYAVPAPLPADNCECHTARQPGYYQSAVGYDAVLPMPEQGPGCHGPAPMHWQSPTCAAPVMPAPVMPSPMMAAVTCAAPTCAAPMPDAPTCAVPMAAAPDCAMPQMMLPPLESVPGIPSAPAPQPDSAPAVQEFRAPAPQPEAPLQDNANPMPPAVEQTQWLVPAPPVPPQVRQQGARVLTRQLAIPAPQ